MSISRLFIARFVGVPVGERVDTTKKEREKEIIFRLASLPGLAPLFTSLHSIRIQYPEQ